MKNTYILCAPNRNSSKSDHPWCWAWRMGSGWVYISAPSDDHSPDGHFLWVSGNFEKQKYKHRINNDWFSYDFIWFDMTLYGFYMISKKPNIRKFRWYLEFPVEPSKFPKKKSGSSENFGHTLQNHTKTI